MKQKTSKVPFIEVTSQLADMAIFLEDNAPSMMGPSYSVNLNFRREGNRLYTSVEAYGKQHEGAAREFSIQDLRRLRRGRAIFGWMGIGIVAALAIVGAIVSRG